MKRIAATALWFCSGWFIGSFAAFIGDMTPLLGPVVATVAAAIVGADPGNRIWGATTQRSHRAPQRQVQNAA
jgi:hypothetical protein